MHPEVHTKSFYILQTIMHRGLAPGFVAEDVFPGGGSARDPTYDLVIYGGTSAGLAAAIPQFGNMQQQVTSEGRLFCFQGISFETPHDDFLKIGLFDAHQVESHVREEMDAIFNQAGMDGLFLSCGISSRVKYGWIQIEIGVFPSSE